MKSGELQQVRRALELFLAPHDHSTPEVWILSAAQSLKSLLGADICTGIVQAPGVSSTSDGFSPGALTLYPELRGELERSWRWCLPKRELKLGVMNRARLYGARLRELERSTYYHELIVPHRAHDGFQMVVPIPGSDRTAAVCYNHERPTGRCFGRHESEILWIVRPAFLAGIAAMMTPAAGGPAARRPWPVLDALARPLMVLELEGRWIHINPKADAVLTQAEPAVREKLKTLVRALVLELRSLLLFGRWEGQPPVTERRLRTFGGEIRLVASLSAPGAFGPERAVVVEILGAESPRRRRLDESRQRFGLTKREAEVAELLALRRSNAEIARQLFISVHTARRHTERVLGKLQVRSRAEVERILGEGVGVPAGEETPR